MSKAKFWVRVIRFDLYNKKKIYVSGALGGNDFLCKKVTAYIGKSELELEMSKNKGIEIRTMYAALGIKADEEIAISILLDDEWKAYNKLLLRFYDENGESVTYTIATGLLKKIENDINYNVDEVKWEGDCFKFRGWAIADEKVDVSFWNNGKKLDADIEWHIRNDVLSEYPEINQGQRVGVSATIPMKKKAFFEVIFTTSSNTIHYKVGDGILQDMTVHNGPVKKLLLSLKRYGIKTTFRKIKRRYFSEGNVKYKKWIHAHEPGKEELAIQRNAKFSKNYKFSIVVPLYRTPKKYLTEMIQSVIDQTYGNWELCLADGSKNSSEESSPLSTILKEYVNKDKRIKIVELEKNSGISENTNAAIKMATGDFVVFGDHDDTFAPNALYECAKLLENDDNVEIIYTDEDKINMSGKKRFDPHFKSDFNIDLLCSINYICHLFVVKNNILKDVGFLDKEYDGAQDHDFILRCVEKTDKIYHIPKILYHWRCHENSTAENPESKLYAFEAGKKAVEAHYKRVGIPATTEDGPFYGTYRTVYHWKENPLISIIIPNKDHVDDLQKCIDSIETKSEYRNYEYIIVENNSCDETLNYYKKLEKENSKVKVVYYKGGFNYSAINNYGSKYASGEYLLLLNNDTEIINPDCLNEMLGYCMREDVGIVGAKLYYEDDTVQHAGVVVGFGGIAGHTFIGFGKNEPGYFNRLVCAQDYSAVTAACLMTKKTIFEAVGGLTEEFKVAFNDIDYCMKVRDLGKLVVYNPYAQLHHYESKSRGSEDTPEKIKRFQNETKLFNDRWPEIFEKGDPYYNPNLSLDRSDFGIKE